MHESKKIFVVCTPEVASLHLAREKMQYLHQLDLADRAVILLNRHNKRSSIGVKEVEALVGVPVQSVFSNDSTAVGKAIAGGVAVPKSTDFGKQCLALAHSLLAKKVEPIAEKRRLVEYFSIAPTRFAFEGKKS
jgi:Flp pilus assembly CpaE family ATPase